MTEAGGPLKLSCWKGERVKSSEAPSEIQGVTGTNDLQKDSCCADASGARSLCLKGNLGALMASAHVIKQGLYKA